MSDPNLANFYSRIARIERNHTKGLGFEAAGTLGRSYYMRPQRKRRSSLLLPMLFVIFAAFGLKAAIYQHSGATAYQERVDQLAAGEGFEKAGAWLMQADPVTIYLSQQIAKGLLMLQAQI